MGMGIKARDGAGVGRSRSISMDICAKAAWLHIIHKFTRSINFTATAMVPPTHNFFSETKVGQDFGSSSKVFGLESDSLPNEWAVCV